MKFTSVILAVLFASCYSQDTGTRTRPTCPELQQMDRFSFLDCDGDRFEEEQCRSNLICYCVDEVTGDRTSNRTYTRREVESGEPCDAPDDDDDTRCPALEEAVERCGGLTCVRKPIRNETCFQCVEGCQGGTVDICNCEDDERCVISGELARRECVEVMTIPEGGLCIPESDDDNDDDDSDDNDDSDDDDDDEEAYQNSVDTLRLMQEIIGEGCGERQVCRRTASDVIMYRCQNRTGPCYENNGRPIGNDAATDVLECEEDDGTYEVDQSSDTHRWCVFPNNGTEIRGSRVQRPNDIDCDRLTVVSCLARIAGRDFRVNHDDYDIIIRNNICQFCRCSNGQFDFCRTVRCPYMEDDTGTRPCMFNRTTRIAHRQIFEDGCNTCRCLNGTLQCTDRDCDDDDDDDDEPDCNRMPRDSVCASNLRTYPSRCAAIRNDFEGPEIISGACTRESACGLFPCEDGYRCVSLSASCSSRRGCDAGDFRKCVNVSQLRCPDMPDASMQVCGENGRTYPSLCHLVQQSRTQVQYRGPCNQANCPVSPVCGTDGITYRSICALRIQPDVRLDYRGECMMPMNRTVRDHCERVRNSRRCAMRTGCNDRVMPSDGCCPICGGGVSVKVDDEGIEAYIEAIRDLATSSALKQRITDSRVVRDSTGMCNVIAQFVSTGDLELLYEARQAANSGNCAREARRAIAAINEIGDNQGTRTRRQTSTGDETDLIFNFMTVATDLDDSTNTNTGGGGGGAAFFTMSYAILFAAMLLGLVV